MQRSRGMMVVVLAGLGLQLAACAPLASGGKPAVKSEPPATVERIQGTNVNRLKLTQKAAERLGIRTAPVREEFTPRAAAQRRAIPYSAVVYDPQGQTWTYTNPEPLLFVRQRIGVEQIDGNVAILSDGPALGTAVVTVGAAELLGLDFGLGK